MARPRLTEAPPLTISKELFKVWKANIRLKDVTKIQALAKAEGIPSSRPTIQKALNYGYCMTEELRDLITEFFEQRNISERAKADKLRGSK